MSRKYSQLNIEERAVIMVLNNQGIKLRAIARRPKTSATDHQNLPAKAPIEQP